LDADARDLGPRKKLTAKVNDATENGLQSFRG
jgi:hypothetical protein